MRPQLIAATWKQLGISMVLTMMNQGQVSGPGLDEAWKLVQADPNLSKYEREQKEREYKHAKLFIN